MLWEYELLGMYSILELQDIKLLFFFTCYVAGTEGVQETTTLFYTYLAT